MAFDFRSDVNLCSYLQKKNQLKKMFIENQKDLDSLVQLNKILQSSLDQEYKELETLADMLKANVKNRCLARLRSTIVTTDISYQDD